MYDPPEYLDATASLDNFITAIKNSLRLWLDLHTNNEAWAASWAMDDEWKELLKNQPILSNSYFTFDLKSACLERYAKKNLESMYKCKFCGSLWDSGTEDCDCQNQEYDDDNYLQLTDDDDLDYFVEWLDEIMFDCDSIPEYIIQDVMETDGFEVYQKSLNSVIAGTVEDIEQALNLFENAETNEDLLTAALIASSILHVNGNILADYGERIGLQYQTVCQYRDNGITSLFSKKEIEDFLSMNMEVI